MRVSTSVKQSRLAYARSLSSPSEYIVLTYQVEELLATPSRTHDLSLPMPMVDVCLY
jgi:hypothetical protein